MKYIDKDELIKTLQKSPVWTGLDAIARINTMSSIDLADYVPRDFHDKTCEEMAKRHQEEIADMVSVVRCKECKYKRIYDGETKYYYCALEDRPNRQWSIDETDYCSWAEREDDR